MTDDTRRTGNRFTDGLIDYLQEVDYRVARSEQDLDEIYQFRYQSYLQDKAIDENHTHLLTDDYDKMDNCWIFGIHYKEQLASSVRIHLTTPQSPRGPSADIFPDIVLPMIEAGQRVVDPTRFVANAASTNHFPVLPFLAFRLACMAADYLEADYCLISVRPDHAPFYQRIFGLTPICEPRHYPQLKSPICLMRADVHKLWDDLIEKYPVFRSTFTERRMLFERPENVMQGVDLIQKEKNHLQVN